MVGVDHARLGTLAGEGHCDRAASCAELQAGCLRREPRQRRVDERLGLGPRDEDGGAHGELAAVELALGDEVGDRPAEGALRAEHVYLRILRLGEDAHRVTTSAGPYGSHPGTAMRIRQRSKSWPVPDPHSLRRPPPRMLLLAR
jgi:hypothetical protein